MKYRDFSDKVRILQNSKNVEQADSESVKLGVSEDFSVATKKDREFLKKCVVSSKQHLGDKMDYGFIKYKTLVIKDCGGYYHNFHVDHIRSSPGTWLRKLEKVDYS